MKFLWGVLFLLLLPGYALTLLEFFADANFPSLEFTHFALGFMIFIPLWFLLVRYARFLLVFEHEFTHMFTGLLFLKRPTSFRASESSGGEIRMEGTNFFIILSPYFLPTFTFLLMPFYLVIRNRYLPYLDGILGIATSFHLLSTLKETSLSQPDIRHCGRVFSLLAILFFNIFFLGFVLNFIEYGFLSGGIRFLVDGLVIGGDFLWRTLKNFSGMGL